MANYQRGDEVPIRILSQGSILVSHAYVLRDYGDALLVYIDLESKRAELLMTGSGKGSGPLIYLIANEHTSYVDETKPKDAPTVIEFPEQQDWRVFSIDGPARYTMCVTLVSPENAL